MPSGAGAVAGPLAFLDGVQRMQLVAYAGAAPIYVAEIAAAVRERQATRLATVVEDRRRLVIARPRALAAAGDALDGLATLGLPEDEPPHPVRDLTQASRALDRARGQLELDLGRSFRRRSAGWLAGGRVAGREPRTGPPIPAPSASPRAMLPCRSMATTWIATSAFRAGHRSSIFAPQSRSVAPVHAWALRLWDWEPKDLFHGSGPHRGRARQRCARDRRPALPLAAGRARADQHARSPLGSIALRHPLRGAVPPRPRGSARLMARALAALAGREFDVLVVGGGITGAVAAWDAAQRGLSVALLERGDFGGATSAESLKVVHGGVRYLQHLDIVRVRESSRERRALLRIAPHLVHPMPFVVPDLRPRHARPGDPRRRASLSSMRSPPIGTAASPIPPGRCRPRGSSPAPGCWAGSPRSIRRGSPAPACSMTARCSTRRGWCGRWCGPPPGPAPRSPTTVTSRRWCSRAAGSSACGWKTGWAATSSRSAPAP